MERVSLSFKARPTRTGAEILDVIGRALAHLGDEGRVAFAREAYSVTVHETLPLSEPNAADGALVTATTTRCSGIHTSKKDFFGQHPIQGDLAIRISW
jgi:hypothetical protein